MWEELLKRFEVLSTRYDMSNAGTELIVIITVSFLLGFLFCFVQNKHKD